jgi:hypothetical protein
MSPVPLDLYGEVTAPDGTTYRWDANQPAGSRPLGLRFGTKTGDGFSDGSLQLARRIDQDYPDLSSATRSRSPRRTGPSSSRGSLARCRASSADRHSIGVTLTGWMAHAKDRKFREVYVDRGRDGWGGMSLARKARCHRRELRGVRRGAGRRPDRPVRRYRDPVPGGWASPYKP